MHNATYASTNQNNVCNKNLLNEYQLIERKFSRF